MKLRISGLLLLVMASCSAHASVFVELEEHAFYGGLGSGITRTSISGRNSHEDSLYLKAFTGFNLSRNWGLELGGLWFDIIDIDGKDAVGEYDIEIRRYDIYAGPTLQFRPEWFVPVRLMAGVSYSSLDMKVSESFYGLAKPGSTSIDDHTTGTYLSAGIIPFRTRIVSGLVSIEYIKRNDFFQESNRPLDARDIALSFRLSFH